VNPWPFVTAAYALTGIVSVGLAAWSFVAMRGSEKK
jgi:hypothetical protein